MTSVSSKLTEIVRQSWREKGHSSYVYIPRVKFFGITIREAYYAPVWFKCEHGSSAVDKAIAQCYEPNSLLKELLEKSVKKEIAGENK